MQIVSIGDNLHEMSNPVIETIFMKCLHQILFSEKNNWDNLHEMSLSKPIFWEK